MKIVEVIPGEPWSRDGKTFHTAKLVCDDGRSGTVNMMTPDRWKIGDEIEVTHEEHTNHGCKWKVSKPGMQNGSGATSQPRPQSPDVQRQINASWAINQVMTHSDFTVKDFDNKGEEIILASRKLLSIRQELIKRMSA